MNRLLESKKQIEYINHGSDKTMQLSPGYRRGRGPKFEESHTRVTTYIQNKIFREIESLRERGKKLNLNCII